MMSSDYESESRAWGSDAEDEEASELGQSNDFDVIYSDGCDDGEKWYSDTEDDDVLINDDEWLVSDE
jgi:hypothetical protein